MDIQWIDAEEITKENAEDKLSGLDGIIVPGGFGDRGISGMIEAARVAREKQIPYFGICLGMQIAVIEFARNVAGLSQANSGESAPDCPQKVIDFMPGQSDEIAKGGTLRLGAYPCIIQPDTLHGKMAMAKERYRNVIAIAMNIRTNTGKHWKMQD